jgi:putative ABC transport system permease protein
MLFLRAPPGNIDALRSAVAAAVPNGQLTSRAERTTAIRASPLMGAVLEGVEVAAAVTAVYAALAVAAAMTLAGASRSLEVAHLRALGLTRRETVWLMAVEHVPTVLVAFLGGGTLGLLLFASLRPGLGLAALVGSDVEVPIQVDPGHLGLILAAIVLILLLGLGLATALQRHSVPAAALRASAE